MDDRHLALRADLVRTRERAGTTCQRGILLVALIPLILGASVIAAFLLGPVAGLLLFLLAGIYTLVGGLAGMGLFVVGIVDRRHSTQELKALDALRMLPAARVVRR